ncbi:uncharacterized protein PFL1_01746 [Pseudozyma flocculosa PF-1]|uniref:Nucleolus and neural progenitor protein-like N-terminal domain-containing protein n=1 Tax=Pseudozyma flocculosa TaxID=84751 RepID=A0A5C3EY17_9BASI|nr:uncharacterized protein PFL1_01746 [Pseudozyma flocculosa PF-1]EPQ30848.1 hypothetical protein PFL1_01746 [Pseudozyma flocculosa PF-1]SPO36780.1 uncharacterized protein PSFLO_02251 [Pseudozyma flocculosa]
MPPQRKRLKTATAAQAVSASGHRQPRSSSTAASPAPPPAPPSSSSTTTTTTTRPARPEAHHASLPKSLRLLLRALLANHARLLEEHRLLDRLWYKGRSQFRTATWWKHIHALRRCLVYLVGSLSSLGTNEGALHRTADAVIAALCSLFDAAPPANAAKGQIRTVPHFSTPATHLDRDGPTSPRPDAFLEAARASHNLALLLHETRKRARTAYRVAAVHLRTPPAPTFAPQVTILLTLAASVERMATDTVLGAAIKDAAQISDARAKNGVETLYSVLRGVLVDRAAGQAAGSRGGGSAGGDGVSSDGGERSSKRRKLASGSVSLPMPSADDTAKPPRPATDQAKPRQRPSKHRRDQLRKARLAAASSAGKTTTPRCPNQLGSLPDTIPDPLAPRRRRSAAVPTTARERTRKRKTPTPLSFSEASEAFDPKRALKAARKFFAKPVAPPPLSSPSGGGIDPGGDDDDDDLGEAIAR